MLCRSDWVQCSEILIRVHARQRPPRRRIHANVHTGYYLHRQQHQSQKYLVLFRYLDACVCKKNSSRYIVNRIQRHYKSLFFIHLQRCFLVLFFFNFRIDLRRGFAGRGGGLHAWCSDLVHLHRLWQSRSRRVGGKAFHYFILRLKNHAMTFEEKTPKRDLTILKQFLFIVWTWARLTLGGSVLGGSTSSSLVAWWCWLQCRCWGFPSDFRVSYLIITV